MKFNSSKTIKILCVLLFVFSFCNPTNALSFLFKVDALIHSFNLYFLFLKRSPIISNGSTPYCRSIFSPSANSQGESFSSSFYSLSVSLPFLSRILENAPTQTEQNTKKLLLRSVHFLFHFVSIPVQHSLLTRHSQSLHILCSFLLD